MKVVIELDGKHALILHNSNVITIHYWFCTAYYFNSGALITYVSVRADDERGQD